MTEDILQEAYLADSITVNKHLMSELGVNAALLYAAVLEQYDNIKNNNKDVTIGTVFEELQEYAHLSLLEMVRAAETLERAGVFDRNSYKVNVRVVNETKGGNADE